MHRTDAFRLVAAEVESRLPGPRGERFALAAKRGQLEVELYKPIDVDAQTPHTRDEAYVVLEGRGLFVMGAERVPFGPGDLLFVPAGLEHRFTDFGETLVAWVIFFGPEGGEPVPD
jgi:mannose-6-phosphate isomerase-like protein (cupin superfamily)